MCVSLKHLDFSIVDVSDATSVRRPILQCYMALNKVLGCYLRILYKFLTLKRQAPVKEQCALRAHSLYRRTFPGKSPPLHSSHLSPASPPTCPLSTTETFRFRGSYIPQSGRAPRGVGSLVEGCPFLALSRSRNESWQQAPSCCHGAKQRGAEAQARRTSKGSHGSHCSSSPGYPSDCWDSHMRKTVRFM